MQICERMFHIVCLEAACLFVLYFGGWLACSVQDILVTRQGVRNAVLHS